MKEAPEILLGRMRKAFIALGVGCALLLFQRPVCGQSQPPEGKGALPNSAFDDDPIGIDPNAPPPDQTTAPAPSPASKARKIDLSFGPSPRRGRAVAGEVLTAMPSVRETRHEVNATLGSGFAQILVHLHLENSVDEPAEILYRLAVPDGAVVTSLRVCRGELCRDGLPQANPQSPSAYDAALLARGPETQGNAEVAPIADVRLAEDERGSFLRLRAAPVRKSEELDLWLGYLVEARVVGGLVRLGLPARGMDPRVAAAKIEFNSGTLTRPQVDDIALEPGQTVERPPWMGLELNAKMASDAGQGVQVATFPCGQMQCNRVRAWAAPAAARPLDIVLAIDGSPSMAGPARNRLSKAVAAVLEAAPVGSTVRAVLFASRAQALIGKRRPLEAVTMAEFGDLLTGHDLGSATRLESVLETVKG